MCFTRTARCSLTNKFWLKNQEMEVPATSTAQQREAEACRVQASQIAINGFPVETGRENRHRTSNTEMQNMKSEQVIRPNRWKFVDDYINERKLGILPVILKNVSWFVTTGDGKTLPWLD